MTNDKNEVYIWEQGDNHPRGWLPVDAIKTKQDHHEHYTRTAHIKQVIGDATDQEVLREVVDSFKASIAQIQKMHCDMGKTVEFSDDNVMHYVETLTKLMILLKGLKK